MAQTFTSTDVVSTTNVFADNQSQRTNENTLRSTFSGSTQPSDPVVGQQWYDTANSKTMQYNGAAWVPVDTNGTTQVDVSNAKGSLTSLTSYLRVAHNDDGTLKTTPASSIDEFKDNALVITYLSPTSFTVPSDLTSIFTANRKVKVYLSASTAISYVVSSTFSTVTTVTLGSAVLDATVTAVKFSIIQDGMPQDYSLALAESTGYGIVSGCAPSINGLIVTVGAGVGHLADGTRKELSARTVTLDAPDSTNPRIDVVYITSAGAIAKVTGTAAATPSAPALPANGISVAQVSVAANATAGTLTDVRSMLPRWYNAGVVNVRDFGAVGDGVTDDTSAIQAALNNAKTIKFPPGKYLISAKIEADNCNIIGNKAMLYSNTKINMILAKNNVVVQNMIFDYNNSLMASEGAMCAIEIRAGKNITVRDCTIEYGLLVFASLNTVGQQLVWNGQETWINDNDLLNQNIIIERCICKGADGKGQAINISFSKNVLIKDNIIDNYGHGIQWFGGYTNYFDAITTTDIKIIKYGYQELCKDYVITGNVISNIGGGGIWGYKGNGIIVTNNIVKRGGDVGIDFESCSNCVAEGNIVEDFLNGCYSTFDICNNIILCDNIARYTGWLNDKYPDIIHKSSAYFHLYKGDKNNYGIDYYSALGMPDVTITIRNNNFYNDVSYLNNGVSLYTKDSSNYGNEPITSLIIDGNKFVNLKSGILSSKYLKNVKVINNEFTVNDSTVATAISVSGLVNIKVNDGFNVIKNNIIDITVNGIQNAIYVQSDVNYVDGCRYIIEGNKVNNLSGVGVNICVSSYQPNTSNNLYVDINNNYTSATTGNAIFIALNPNDLTNIKVKMENNKILGGGNFPNDVPTWGYWLKGQKVYYDDISTKNAIGAVCTVSGMHGTWKNFGTLANLT